MSRAYKIRVRESLRRVVRAVDKVSSQLELLAILPEEEMIDILAGELEKRGFERKGDVLVRQVGQVTITIDEKGVVTGEAESKKDVKVEGERTGRGYDDVGPTQEQQAEELRKQLMEDLEKQTGDHQSALQKELTDELEAVLGDVRKELDQALNATTAEALKRKASQMGEIQEIAEDPETGSLTIVVEV